MLSDGTVLNGTVLVVEDVHVENSTSPAIGSSFGADETNDDEPDVEDDSKADGLRRMLLLVGAGSGLGAAGMLVLLLMRRS